MVVLAGVSLGVMQPVAPLLEPKPHGYDELTVMVVAGGGAAFTRAINPVAAAAESPAAMSVPAGLLSCDDHEVPMVPAGQVVLLLMVVQPYRNSSDPTISPKQIDFFMPSPPLRDSV